MTIPTARLLEVFFSYVVAIATRAVFVLAPLFHVRVETNQHIESLNNRLEKEKSLGILHSSCTRSSMQCLMLMRRLHAEIAAKLDVCQVAGKHLHGPFEST